MELAPAAHDLPRQLHRRLRRPQVHHPVRHLRLRMSGPTAGRLIQAEIGDRFASANLPMLHRRTAADDVQDEFRPAWSIATMPPSTLQTNSSASSSAM